MNQSESPIPSVPIIGVVPNRFVEGARSLHDAKEPLEVLSAPDALQAGWPTDAHFVCYHTHGTGQRTFPRLHKVILPLMRQAGHDVRVQVLAFDYDNPDHAPWDESVPALSRAAFIERFHKVCEVWPFAANYSLIYTTRGGARLVYFLDQPVPADDAEGMNRWMREQFLACGLEIDEQCSDWTRLFRLPFVRRDRVNSWEESPMLFFPQWHARLAASTIPKVERPQGAAITAEIRPFDVAQPDEETARRLLREVNPQTGNQRDSKFVKEAKRILRGRDCHDCLFKGTRLAESGKRNATLMRYVGQAVAMLFPTGCTPEDIYALFWEAVSHLEPDANTPDWHRVLWEQIGRVWQLEDAKARGELLKADIRVEEQLQGIDLVAEGMRAWCDAPELRGDKATVHAFVSRHLIASHMDTYRVMRRDGYYCKNAVTGTSLVPEIKRLGMDDLIQIVKVGEDGGLREVERGTIIRQHCTLVSRTTLFPERTGGIITGMGRDSATLEAPSYRRNPNLEPRYSPEVDEWMRAAFQQHHGEVAEWISWALAWEEGPICALSIKAGPGIGKKILAQGLVETLEQAEMATDADMTGDYNYNLAMSPFLVVDEGWSQNKGGKNAADSFRRLSAGGSIEIKRKYLAPEKVFNPVRILFTANDHAVVRALVAGREMGPDGKQSIEDRLRHYDVGNQGAVYLASKGGLLHTGAKGRRWIAGDGGEPSDFVVARHFLHLYANRGPRQSGRFLLMGRVDDEMMFEFRTAAPANQRVAECLLRILNLQQEREGVCIQDHRIFVLPNDVLEFYRVVMSRDTRMEMTIQQVNQALEHFTLVKHTGSFSLRERPNLKRMRWHEIDPQLLQDVAVRQGWKCQRLEGLIAELETFGIRDGLQLLLKGRQ